MAELRRFNSLSGRSGKGGDGADRILPPILRTLQLLLAPAPTNVKVGKLRLLDGGVAGLRVEKEEPRSEVDDLRKVTHLQMIYAHLREYLHRYFRPVS